LIDGDLAHLDSRAIELDVHDGIAAPDDLMDVCIDGRRTLITRYDGPCTGTIFAFVQNGTVTMDVMKIRPLV